MNKFKTSAIEILKKTKKPLHIRDIARMALDMGILETDGATPEQSMNANISVDIKLKGKASDFIRVSPSTYILNRKKKGTKRP